MASTLFLYHESFPGRLSSEAVKRYDINRISLLSIVKRYFIMSASGATDSGYLPIVLYYKLSVI